MAVQQSSLDFFNATPEPSKVKGGELFEIIPVKPEEKKESLEYSEISEIKELQQSAELTVDEEVREIEFVAADPTGNRQGKQAKKSTRGRMKLSDMDLMVDLVDVPDDEILFQKRYYGISEVSKMFKVNISLLRFWENEFDILKPKKNGKGDRFFRPEDVKNLQLIYHLLREKKYTIEGARDFLKKNKQTAETFALIDTLKKTKAFLLDLKANL